MVAKFLRFPLCGHGVSGDWGGCSAVIMGIQYFEIVQREVESGVTGDWSNDDDGGGLECNGNIFKVAVTAAEPQHFENAHEQERASWID